MSKSQPEYHLVRISKKAKSALVKHVFKHDARYPAKLNASKFISEAVLRHIANNQPECDP